MAIPSLICRGKNLHLSTIKQFLYALPQKDMPKDEFDSFAEQRMNGFITTHSQIARQMALYYTDDNNICHPRFKRRLSNQEILEYMEFWAKRYFVPNPYTPSFDKEYKPKNIYSFLYHHRHDGNDIDTSFYQMFNTKVNEIDKAKSYLLQFTDIVINSDGSYLFPEGTQLPVDVDIDRYDKEAFFEYFNQFDRQANQYTLNQDIMNNKYHQFLTAIRTKPFLLLAGISGTGKSQVVKEMAFATCPDIDDLQNDKASPGNYCMIEVKPNWHDSTELLGYDSAIKKRYIVTKFVKFVVKAMRYPNVPFFVCLDEMNLAPVEQYLAEFLSVLESRKLIGDEIYSEPLIDKAFFQDTLLEYDLFDIPLPRTGEMSISKAGDNNAGLEDYAYTWRRLQHEGLCIPQNLIVIGTVNMDETTHQFSRKVIDRAMTFEMNEANFVGYFQNKVTLDYVDEPLSADLFLARNVSGNRALDEIDNLDERVRGNVVEKLKELNKALDDTPFKIAYRVQNELVLYFAELLRENPNADQLQLLNTALDDIMMMKVLPRIEGDDELLGNRTDGALFNLMQFASNNNLEHSVDKIDEMLKRLERSHFTSYWP